MKRTGQAFPPNLGKVIGRLDAAGNLVQVEDRPIEKPVSAHTGACGSTQDNQPLKEPEARHI